MANNNVKATSLTIGAEIKNENVTPNGTPACTKPINNGIAEHEPTFRTPIIENLNISKHTFGQAT
jgi:hypothetical protein